MKKTDADRYELYSQVLEQKAIITDYGAGIMEMRTQDGVCYTPPEMLLLFNECSTFNRRVHVVKRLFGGKIVSVQRKSS